MQTAPTRFLPRDIGPWRVRCCVGLVSDTHIPERRAGLPTALFDVLAGVDLILHAGDVGMLRVLDRLGALAPVVAVHGNDETEDAQRELPSQQLIMAAGQRLLLCHSHLPDPGDEQAARGDDGWGPKLDRRAGLGQRAGAGVVVFGHTHIPMALTHRAVLLVNPGALASGSWTRRQRLQTVALLFLLDRADPVVVHVDLAVPERAFRPQVAWEAGYRAAHMAVTDPILSPALAIRWERVAARVRTLPPHQARSLLLRVAYPCWNDGGAVITPGDLLAAVRADPLLPDAAREDLEAVLAASQHR